MPSLRQWLATLIGVARNARHRRLLVLAGESEWCLGNAKAIQRESNFSPALWISERAPEGAWRLAGQDLHRILGRDVELAIFDAHSGFDPDAFGAVAGTLRGGGLLLLLTPALDAWPRFDDPEHARIATPPWTPAEVTGRFLRRLVRVLREDTDTLFMEQDRPFPPVGADWTRDTASIEATKIAITKSLLRVEADRVRDAASIETTPTIQDPDCLTTDQRRAVEAIVKVAKGHRRRPLVLTSDRGRGKSAAFGIAAARLLRAGLKHIVITAPSLDTATPVFEHAARLLPGARTSRGALHLNDAAMRFAPPDELVRTARPADLLLVDEAAAIPTALSQRLLAGHARIAFATTVHGYEGTGRGFALRFHRVLDRLTPDWKALRLETPIRWAPGDPLERLVSRALLLDATVSTASEPIDPNACVIERLDRDRLADDEPTLSQLFGLLVLAHYRTRPYDLRHLLDGPNLSVYLMRRDRQVVATALLATEGGLTPDMAQAVFEGRRRLRGHLIPQSLAAHAGFTEMAGLHGARIMRIAVHPALQGQGLGTRLIQQIVATQQTEGLDWLGTSFGASVELLRFWRRAGFLPLRVGLTRAASSGAHAAILLHPLSENAAGIVTQARRRFHEHLPHLLSEPLRQLEPDLAAALLQDRETGPRSPLDQSDRRDLAAFAFSSRGYESCLAPIWKLACSALADPADSQRLTPPQRDALILKVLQKRGWAEVAEALGVSGRTAATEMLRGAVAALRGRFEPNPADSG